MFDDGSDNIFLYFLFLIASPFLIILRASSSYLVVLESSFRNSAIQVVEATLKRRMSWEKEELNHLNLCNDTVDHFAVVKKVVHTILPLNYSRLHPIFAANSCDVLI